MTEGIPEESDPPPAGSAEEVADLLHHVTGRLRHAVRHDLHPSGVTPAQWRALRVITRCDTAPRMSDIADRLRIARRSATAVVDELEQQGLVARSPDPGDRRAVVVEVTEDGRATLATLSRQRRQAAARHLEVLSDEQLATLAQLLARIDQG